MAVTPEIAAAILVDEKEFQSWLGVTELDPAIIANVFLDVEAARRGNPEAQRRIIENMALEFDRLVRRMTDAWPEETPLRDPLWRDGPFTTV